MNEDADAEADADALAITAAAEGIEREFAAIGDWSGQLRHLMELGRTLTRLTEVERTEVHRVHGCQSQLWLIVVVERSRLRVRADSDAMIMRGALSLILRLYDDRPPMAVSERLRDDGGQPAIIERLAPNRSTGLRAVLTQIEKAARAASGQPDPSR